MISAPPITERHEIGAKEVCVVFLSACRFIIIAGITQKIELAMLSVIPKPYQAFVCFLERILVDTDSTLVPPCISRGQGLIDASEQCLQSDRGLTYPVWHSQVHS
jgi:hypothetical protein